MKNAPHVPREVLVRSRLRFAGLALALAALAALGGVAGTSRTGWDAASVGLVVVAVGLVAIAVGAVLSLRRA